MNPIMPITYIMPVSHMFRSLDRHHELAMENSTLKKDSKSIVDFYGDLAWALSRWASHESALLVHITCLEYHR